MPQWTKRLALVLALIGCLFVLAPAPAIAEDEVHATGETVEVKQQSLNATTMPLYVGGSFKLKLSGVSAKKVKWKSSKPSVAVVSKKGKIKAKRKGSCTITAKYQGKTYKCKVKVLSDKKYLKSWCKALGKEIKREYSSPYDRVLAASWYVSMNFGYGHASSAVDVLKKGKGTCTSANKLLVEVLKAMGFKAKVRFAAKDDPTRYPGYIMFGSDHHNVKVTIKGKTYYVDGTPGSGCLYMSTSKKNIYFAYTMPGYEQVVTDKLPR